MTPHVLARLIALTARNYLSSKMIWGCLETEHKKADWWKHGATTNDLQICGLVQNLFLRHLSLLDQRNRKHSLDNHNPSEIKEIPAWKSHWGGDKSCVKVYMLDVSEHRMMTAGLGGIIKTTEPNYKSQKKFVISTFKFYIFWKTHTENILHKNITEPMWFWVYAQGDLITWSKGQAD